MGVKIKVVKKKTRKHRRGFFSRLFKPSRFINPNDLPDVGTSFRVREVNLGEADLFPALGITPEVKEKLIKKSHNAFSECKNICAAMEMASEGITNANELFALSFIMTQRHLKSNEIGGLLEAILSRGGDKD